MAEQKKPAARKAAATGEVSGATKIPKAAAKVAKKPATKRTSTATAEPEKPKAPAVKKTAAPAAGKQSPVKKAAAAKTTAEPQPTSEERCRMVQTAAYFIAERNGFQGHSTDHWAAAELEIATRLGE